MTPSSLRSCGLSVSLDGASLMVGPAYRLDPALRAKIKAHRDAIIVALEEEDWRAREQALDALESVDFDRPQGDSIILLRLHRQGERPDYYACSANWLARHKKESPP